MGRRESEEQIKLMEFQIEEGEEEEEKAAFCCLVSGLCLCERRGEVLDQTDRQRSAE